jgi:hypothetical protein
MKAYGGVDIYPRIPGLDTFEVNGQLRTPAALSAKKDPRYPLDRRLSGPQNQSGQGKEEKNLALIEIRVPNFQTSTALPRLLKNNSSFLPLGATAQGELWPPEQSAAILLYIHPRLIFWFLNNLVFMV